MGGTHVISDNSGLNTNPEMYKVLHGFRSQVITRAGGVATALWTVAMASTPKRTAGMSTYVYWVTVYNPTNAPVTGWLEIGGVLVTIPFSVDTLKSLAFEMPLPLPLGNNDINCNASVNGVRFQIGGYEI